MKVFRWMLVRLGRALLAAALISTSVAKSTLGEAIVVHQHGVFRAHLHVLGFGDLLSNGAFSPRFGHYPASTSRVGSISQGTIILAIITTGSAFVSDPRPGSDDADLNSLQSVPSLRTAEPRTGPRPRDVSSDSAGYADLNASAAILLRSHALLI